MRDPGRAAGLAAEGVELVRGDLADATALRQLVADCDGVIHAAGAVRGASAEDFDRVNVAGTQALLQAVMSAAPAARFVLVSSLAAREPQLSWYAASKRAAERQVESIPQLDWVILRPPAVYGPGDREMLPVFEWMARGLAPVPGDTRARFSLVHVSDLAGAVAACLEADAARHCTLYAGDGRRQGYDWREAAAIAGQLCGRHVRLCRLPAALLDAVAACNLQLARLTGRKPMLTPPKLRELRHPDWVVDNEAITAATGWRPQVSLEAGLADLLRTGRAA